MFCLFVGLLSVHFVPCCPVFRQIKIIIKTVQETELNNYEWIIVRTFVVHFLTVKNLVAKFRSRLHHYDFFGIAECILNKIDG